jgi:hypothetical protein
MQDISYKKARKYHKFLIKANAIQWDDVTPMGELAAAAGVASSPLSSIHRTLARLDRARESYAEQEGVLEYLDAHLQHLTRLQQEASTVLDTVPATALVVLTEVIKLGYVASLTEAPHPSAKELLSSIAVDDLSAEFQDKLATLTMAVDSGIMALLKWYEESLNVDAVLFPDIWDRTNPTDPLLCVTRDILTTLREPGTLKSALVRRQTTEVSA